MQGWLKENCTFAEKIIYSFSLGDYRVIENGTGGSVLKYIYILRIPGGICEEEGC